MKFIKLFLLLMCIACMGNAAYAQMISDPTSWTYEVKKTGLGRYDLIFHLKIKKEWHIWSLKPGGDGLQIPPSFKFNNDPAVHLVGNVREVGKHQTVTMEGIEGKVTLFSDKVDYVQSVLVKKKIKITGTHDYQVCSNTICLPPKTKAFTFNIN